MKRRVAATLLVLSFAGIAGSMAGCGGDEGTTPDCKQDKDCLTQPDGGTSSTPPPDGGSDTSDQ